MVGMTKTRVFFFARHNKKQLGNQSMVEEATGLIYISVRPNLLRPLNACGMVLRSSLTIEDASTIIKMSQLCSARSYF